MTEFSKYIHVQDATVDRLIFSDPEIYRQEQAQIFERSWNFMCHESQIVKSGDFFCNFIGEESVIAVRDKSGAINVFLNSCRHRGNPVCRAEKGNARTFLCSYHGWSYDLAGKLKGVPGYRAYYKEMLAREDWGLVSAAKVQSYKGFVFATMDPGAPDLESYLGEVGRIGLSLIADQGDMVCVEGVQKNRIPCNWKVTTDNVFDFYHLDISHASALMSGVLPRATGESPLEKALASPMASTLQRVVLGDYGHAIGGPRIVEPMWDRIRDIASGKVKPDRPDIYSSLVWRLHPDAQQSLGPVGKDVLGHPHIFPNLWIGAGGTQLCLRLAKGAGVTELWWFTFVNRDLPPEIQAFSINNIMKIFGPAGLLEQDDGENWALSTRGTRGPIARRHPLNYQMNSETELTIPENGPAYIDTTINEHAQMWSLRSWANWMDSPDWETLRANAANPRDVFTVRA